MSDRIRLDSITVNAPDAIALARFYAEITRGTAAGDSDWAAVTGPHGSMAFQQVDDFRPPDWPVDSVPTQLHLDFHVDDLEATGARVLAAGARRFDAQPNADHCTVYADPVGHPFCLSTWTFDDLFHAALPTKEPAPEPEARPGDEPTAWGVTVDCANPRALARFWALALGYREPPALDGFATWDAWLADQGVPEDERDGVAYLADPSGRLPTLSFVRVPEPKTTKNRLHLDVKVSGGRDVPADRRESAIRAKVAQLCAAGARTLREHDGPRGLDHVVLADPEGNELCVV